MFVRHSVRVNNVYYLRDTTYPSPSLLTTNSVFENVYRRRTTSEEQAFIAYRSLATGRRQAPWTDRSSGPCHGSDGLSSDSDRGGPDSTPGQRVFCLGQNGIRPGFSPSTSVFACQHHCPSTVIIRSYTVFAGVICALFFVYFGRWKIGVGKICVFLWRSWSGFYSSIPVVPRNLSLLIFTTLYNYSSSFQSWNFNISVH
jgi:hypothetical protein